MPPATRSSARRVTWPGAPALLAVALLGPLASATGAVQTTLAPCTHLPAAAGARCGVHTVREDRHDPGSRRLDLDVIVLPATGDDPRPDPLIYLAGGPGVGATLYAASLADWTLRRDRDVVLVDQRGTAGSHRLACSPPLPPRLVGSAGDTTPRPVADASSDDLADTATDADDLARRTAELQAVLDPGFELDALLVCRERLARRADLRLYTTPIAMDDLDEVLSALGYDEVNLVGGSHGTRAALIFMRRHGDRVRSAILEGVAPLSMRNPLLHAASAQRALDLLFGFCAADPACGAAFPGLGDQFDELLHRLDAEPAEVTVADPESGRPLRLRLSREAFADSVRTLSYRSVTAARLPALIHAAHGDDWQPFVRQAIELRSGLFGATAMGMLLCVTCSADVTRISDEDVARHTAGTYLGDGRVQRQRAICAQWPPGELPAGYAESVTVDLPVLIVSGLIDPVTPPAFGDLVAQTLPDALHLVVPGAHDFWSPCLEGIEAQFVDRASTSGLDVSCLASLSLPPFDLGD